MENIVILDGYTTNPGDLSWDKLAELGRLAVYDRTPSELVETRAAEASILLTNKVVIDAKMMDGVPNLRCISVMATGYNVVDVEAARQRGIVVCNIRGYATDSVAQHVFALLLELTNMVGVHNAHVQQGGWAGAPDWSYTLSPTLELAGKTIGILGFGLIGQRVAEIAQAFGMKVLAHHKHPERDQRPGVTFVSWKELFQNSDVVSLHAPLTPENQGIVNKTTLSLMKTGAYLINTSRGSLINESDLKWALENGVIAGAALDVLSVEPPPAGHTLIGINNCLLTPHNAWATKEARTKLIDETVENIKAYLVGKPRNVVG